VSQVRRDTPAVRAGVNVEDEIVAVDEHRVRAEQWDARMDAYRAGDRVSLLVSRRDRLRRLDVTLGAEPQAAWRLELDPNATPVQQAQLGRWLTGYAAPRE